MTQEQESRLIQAKPGDGTFAGARTLYLEQGLSISLIDRLRAVEDMAASARMIQQVAARSQAAK